MLHSVTPCKYAARQFAGLKDCKVVQLHRRLWIVFWIVTELSQRPDTIVLLVFWCKSQTSVFAAAGADRLNNVVHHDRAGGRQFWYFLQRSAVDHQGLVGESLPVHLHHNCCAVLQTLSCLLLLIVHVCAYTRTGLVYTYPRCVCCECPSTICNCATALSVELMLICMSATVASVSFAYNAILSSVSATSMQTL